MTQRLGAAGGPTDSSIQVARAELKNYLWLHPGTERPSDITDDGESYTETAVVPVAERRRLSPSELTEISSRWYWPASDCIASFRVDDGVLAELRRPENHAHRDINSADSREAGHRLWELLCESSPVSSLGPMQWLGLSMRPSGLRTSTFDVGMRRRIGLHLDSWDRTPLPRRHLARTRLCINLGLRSRGLLFLAHDIRAISQAMADDPGVHNANIGERFCTRFPDAPVLDLEIPPGYAYLAPSDNIIHDGQSEPSTAPDVTVAWLGMITYSAAFE